MNNPHAITVTSQKKSLSIDFAGAFKSLFKIGANVAAQDYVGLGLDLVDLVKSLNLATTVEQKAYLLITEGYTGGLASIWKSNWLAFKRSNDPNDLAAFAEMFDKALDKKQPGLMPDFFLAPHKFSMVPIFAEILANELPAYLKEPNKANEIAQTFPDKFYHFVIQAWNQRQAKYQDIWGQFQGDQFLDIQEHLDAFRTQVAQEAYHDSLRKMYHELVMDDDAGMTLADIYIKPQFRVSERCFDEGDERYKNHKRKLRHAPFIPVEYPDSLQEYMFDFIKQKNPLELASSKPKVFLLLGYPGQGKTSFCKRFIHDLLDSGRSSKNVFYLPLRLVRNVREKLATPLDLILDALNNDITDQYPGKVTHQLLKGSILVLDGLDEIFQREGLSHDDIDEFCQELRRISVDTPKLKIILTSRYGYITLNKLRKKEFFIAQLEKLSPDQQLAWLEKYTKFHPNTGLNPAKLNEINDKGNQSFSHIRELINQPILLQLVATADYDLQESDTRTKIYDELFQALIDRNWGEGGQLDNLEGLEKADVLAFLSDIAMAIYKSEYEYIRKIDLEKLNATSDFREKLGGRNLNDVLKNLMIAFYMKEVRKEKSDQEEEDRNYAIEFLHKSLQEYLVARNIWQRAKTEFLAINSISKKYLINSWQDMLKVLRELFAHKELSEEVQGYLREMILQDTGKEKKQLQGRLLEFFPEMLQRDFGEFSEKRVGNQSPIQESFHTFYGCWFLISHIRSLEKERWEKIPPSKFHYLLRCPPPPRSAYSWSLKHANLQGADLQGADLQGADLQGADLYRAKLQRANLRDAKLPGAKLQGAGLYGAYLQRVNLKGAKLQDANLRLAGLYRANLRGANLQGVSLHGADLQGADLKGANLQDAKLYRADLQEADLKGAKLKGAKLFEANLQEAQLRGAMLYRADLQDAKLKETFLQGANLQEADLQGAILQKAILQDADLQGAILRRAMIQRAELQGAILQKAMLQEAMLQEADLAQANLQRADLQGAILQGAILQGAKLQGANLQEANLQKAYLQGANLQKADLRGANLQKAYLARAKLQEANLKGAILQEADLKGAKLRSAMLQDANLQKTNFQGANLRGADFLRADLQGAYLEGANLEGADLQGANLKGTKLQGAKLKEVTVYRAYFQEANLIQADLRGANLNEADLWGAMLQRADLQRANLKEANLRGANLRGANLQEANLRGANLRGANLQEANLQEVSVDKINWLEELFIDPESKKTILSAYQVVPYTFEDGEPGFMIVKKE